MLHVVCPNPALDRTIFLEKFDVNGVSRSHQAKELLGGKGFNVIRSFSFQNPNSAFTAHAFLGGYIGKHLQTLANDQNISTTVTPIKENTRICSIIVDNEKGHAHLINEKGPVISTPEKQAFEDTLLDSVKPEDYVVFSGSLPGGLSSSFYRDLIISLQDKGAKCVIDSSGEALSKSIEAKPWLLKVNESEYLELKNQTADTTEKIITLLKNDTALENIIITLGGDGSIAKIHGKCYRVTLPNITAKNATASGDIFLGKLLEAFQSNKEIQTALIEASSFAASNCLYWYPHIDMNDVNEIKEQITLEEL
ncbi:1-phosphofructokinase family hexose kinase [Oceanobacillus sp. FSL K6-0251]|uniref:1-phosphofructokinase family hexose kinase n=1 Tax=Oceanobacillus sp. FSL K6-0251 TaxID=2921602 RepID=UPI0030FC263E